LGLLAGALVCWPSAASAAPVLVMGRDGHVAGHNDPFLPTAYGPSGESGPRNVVAHRARRPAAPSARVSRASQRTVRSELARLYRSGQISASQYHAYSASFSAALRTERRLRGTRATELTTVVENLHALAVRRQLTPSRLPVLFLTLDRNRQWWTTGPIPATWQRIEFSGSQLVWQYYPGQGLELQVLGTFGKADGLYAAGPRRYPAFRSLLTEMIPLAAQRAGGPVWEYYFRFDGGSPPWASAMAQGTAIEALTRAYHAFGDQSYLQLAHQALSVFMVAPPLGVRVATAAGARYLQYSFAPGTDIINAYLQSLIGLYDYGQASGDTEAQQLFAAGNAQATAELPQFDTGAWSLYQPGVEDSLDYHKLVTGFLDQLCSRTDTPVYCATAQHFNTYLKTPPALSLVTQKVRPRSPNALRFRLSKYSRVGIVVLRGGRSVFLTSASFGYGVRSFALPALRAGSYEIHLAATDLAGNFNRIVGTLTVSRHPRSS
jgi:hypothetical protein